MRKYIFAALLVLLPAAVSSCKRTVYIDAGTEYVAGADGSRAKPYKDFETAFNAVREHMAAGNKNVEMVFRGGTYYFRRGYLIDEAMSGLTIKAYDGEEVVFSGGVSIPVESVSVSENTVPGGKLSVANLKEAGIADFGAIHGTGFGRPFLSSWGEVFVNGKPMRLSRWPDEGTVPMGKVLDPGSVPRDGDYSNRGAVMEYDSLRISSWEPDGDMWISGYFKYGYADDALRIAVLDKDKKTITTDGPTMYGFQSGRKHNQWYAFNIKEETGMPGEYHLDRNTGELVFVSPDKEVEALDFSLLEEPFFDIWQARDVMIDGITFEYSRAVILSLAETENVLVKNCVFRNSGSLAVTVGYGIKPFEGFRHEGTGEPVRGLVGSLQQHIYNETTFDRKAGNNNTIDRCGFYNLGAGAVSLGGGDRLTLSPGNNTVSNCLFHDNNRIERSYRPAVHITGVGNKVVNCEMYNAPSMVILLHGNDHVIENNYIHDVCLEVDDQGAFYYGRDASECGNVVRNNLFANIPDNLMTSSVYLDDGAGGLAVEGNIFYKAGFYPILLGGGSDNVITGNIFIGSKTGIHIDNRLQGWAKGQIAEGGIFEVRLRAVDYLGEPYASAYPYLKDYIPHDGVPKRNLITDNLFAGVERVFDIPSSLEVVGDNKVCDGNAGIIPYTKEGLFEELAAGGLKSGRELGMIGILK